MNGPNGANDWFAALSDTTKRHLVSDPHALVPRELLEEVCAAGGPVNADRHLPAAFVHYLVATKLREDLNKVYADLAREHARYFPIADLNTGVPAPEATFDDLAHAALNLLQARQRFLSEQYDKHVSTHHTPGYTGAITF